MSLAERTSRERKLEAAAVAVSRCTRCPQLVKTRTTTVYGEGDAMAEVMVVGEGPGETEDKLGRPFVGRAGALLEKMLLAIGLPRESVFICNTVKCRPTLDDGVRLKNRPPTPDEMDACRGYLDQQIAIIRPRAILCLGSPAAKTFLGPKFAISRQRGQWFDGPDDIPLIATFHPSYLLRLTGGEIDAVKRLVWNDLKALRAKLDAPPPVASPEPVEQPNLFDV